MSPTLSPGEGDVRGREELPSLAGGTQAPCGDSGDVPSWLSGHLSPRGGRTRLGVLQTAAALHRQGLFLHSHRLRRPWRGTARGTSGAGTRCPHVPPPQLSRSTPPGQTQLMFKWAEPKICSEELPQATKLPPSGVKTRCPPCNPGFAKSNGSACQPCPYGSYSNGSGKDVPSIPSGDNACAHSANTRVHVYIVQTYACRCNTNTFMQI